MNDPAIQWLERNLDETTRIAFSYPQRSQGLVYTIASGAGDRSSTGSMFSIKSDHRESDGAGGALFETSDRT